jgi:glycylpeptide N-tetradecanoyltransferase
VQSEGCFPSHLYRWRTPPYPCVNMSVSTSRIVSSLWPTGDRSYYHRSLNVRKLVETGFNYVPRDMTLARMIRQHKVPDSIVLSGVREMEERDVPEVMELYQRYMKRFDMSPVMTQDDIYHQFLSGRGTGESVQWARTGQVVWSYVVEVRKCSSIRSSILISNLVTEPRDSSNHRLFHLLLVTLNCHRQ